MRFRIGNTEVGGESVYIVAEISANHNGSLIKAKELVYAAKEAGADAVKLQTYKASTITLDSEKEDFLIPKNNPWSKYKTIYNLYEYAHTPWEWHHELFDLARKIGIDAFSSPFDESAVDFLEGLECPAYKIASPEITDVNLIRKVALTQKPIVISTGLAHLEDIELAAKTVREAGNDKLILLRCVASYPTPIEESNLKIIQEIESKFSCLSGLSDHTMGIVAPVVATSVGAKLIEKHFCLSKEEETPDSFFSLDVSEFTNMVKAVREAEKALGSGQFDLGASARENFRGRRSLYVSRPIRRGEILNLENIKSVRPGLGLHPKYLSQVLGREATRDLEPGDRLSLDCVHLNETK